MTEKEDSSIGATAFALFALQQELDLEQIRSGVEQGELASAEMHSPEWFAAAASRGASLLETAAELQSADPRETATGSKTSGLDLVRMYAPELAALEGISTDTAPTVNGSDSQGVKTVSTPGGGDPATKSVHLGLLKELEDFDT